MRISIYPGAVIICFGLHSLWKPNSTLETEQMFDEEHLVVAFAQDAIVVGIARDEPSERAGSLQSLCWGSRVSLRKHADGGHPAGCASTLPLILHYVSLQGKQTAHGTRQYRATEDMTSVGQQ